MEEHKIALKELFAQLRSSKQGLTSAEVHKRRLEHGENALEEKKKKPFVIRFGKHFINYFAILLWIGSILSFFASFYVHERSYLYIGIALALVVALNAIFTFIQEYKSEKIMESFKKMLPNKILCLRDGERKEILAKNLVPGDIIYLAEGDKIPADGRLIAENSLKVDNSSLTGESEPQLRKLQCTHDNMLESRNMIFSGTLVQTGNGTAVVTRTGMNTQIGNIVTLTKIAEVVTTPLRKEIKRFVNIISAIAIVLGILFFITSIIIGNPPVDSLIFAIGIIVANVPEGLLPTVTLALSMAAKKMAKKKALIKNLESVETLGSTTVICTDKTGTLTENKMKVHSVFMNMQRQNMAKKVLEQIPGLNKLLHIAILCNNARLNKHDSYYGDPTEGSLLVFARKFIKLSEIFAKNKRIHESPFDSKTKRMITTGQFNGNNTAYLKGAPEVVLSKCNKLLLNGKVIKLTQKQRQEIIAQQQNLASSGERVLALAYKETPHVKAAESGFIFVALIGMLDPLRKEVPHAVSKCKNAGIRVIMLTGDYSVTAEAIGRQCGIINNGTNGTITGADLDKMAEDELQDILKGDNIILARISPHHKLRVVRALQAMGEVVTVTGDGVNDAPALKNANMGVAMGKIGTEVAKEASDMVLLDDNFATIVAAIEEGRTVYNNIKRFISYILTSNIPEIVPFIAFVLLGLPLPLTVVLILCIDLGTDLLPALGLGTEKAESDIMKLPPRSRSERLLSWIALIRSYGIVGPIETAAGFFCYFAVLYSGGWHWGVKLAMTNPLYLKAVAAFFASIILCQIPNVLICRTKKQSLFKRGLFSNKLINYGILSELILLAIIIYNPFTQPFFGTTYLKPLELLLVVPFMLLIFFASEFRKWLLRNNNAFVAKYLNW